jgi:hypothetical protein
MQKKKKQKQKQKQKQNKHHMGGDGGIVVCLFFCLENISIYSGMF